MMDCPEHLQGLVALLERTGKRNPKKDRIFACWCVRNTPLLDGRKVWDLLTDERSRYAVATAESYAAGITNEQDLDVAFQAAWKCDAEIARKINAARQSGDWGPHKSGVWQAAFSAAHTARPSDDVGVDTMLGATVRYCLYTVATVAKADPWDKESTKEACKIQLAAFRQIYRDELNQL